MPDDPYAANLLFTGNSLDGLLRQALCQLREDGFRSASLQATEASQGLYASAGFRAVGQWSGCRGRRADHHGVKTGRLPSSGLDSLERMTTGGHRARRVSMMLVDRERRFLGALPDFDNGFPWWPETQSLLNDVRERFGVEATVVRIIDTVDKRMLEGGGVTYLAELDGPTPPAVRSPDDLGPTVTQWVESKLVEDQPHRAWWARVGAVDEAMAWADAQLAAAGRTRNGRGIQVKSWNLSLVLQIPTDDGPVWLKATPPFLAHEGDIIEMVARCHPELVPRLIARDSARGLVLMEDIPGEDQWHAAEDVLVSMVTSLVPIQLEWVGRTEELLGAGLPDRRLALLAQQVDEVLRRDWVRARLTEAELELLDTIVARLPQRVADIAQCGIPETLLRGDFHPGNWRYDGTSLVLLDWGDSEVGHPLLDAIGFLSWIPDLAVRARVRLAWTQAWRNALPGSDPDRAIDLVEPLGHLRGAIIYQRFVDNIEDDERRYHKHDVPECLREAAEDERLLAW